MSGFPQLGLWADEEKRIQTCLTKALEELIAQNTVTQDDQEKPISGKLRPFVRKHCGTLGWTFHPEASVFSADTDAEPSGHPDIQFSRTDSSGNQWDYDVECKLVRAKRARASTDYCGLYVTRGIADRYLTCTYASHIPSATMIGYVQAGGFRNLLQAINHKARREKIPKLQKSGVWKKKGVSRLNHTLLRRSSESFLLSHLWADLRG